MAIDSKGIDRIGKFAKQKNILQQPTSVANTTSKPHPKNKSPQKQTNTISRMRMALGFKAYR
jgi:hypothetical protein